MKKKPFDKTQGKLKKKKANKELFGAGMAYTLLALLVLMSAGFLILGSLFK